MLIKYKICTLLKKSSKTSFYDNTDDRVYPY